MISIKFRSVALIAYLLLLIPIGIFFWGWLKWYFALVFTLAMLIGFVWLFQHDYPNHTERLKLPTIHFMAILVVCALWTAASGGCHIGAGLWDIPWRNIILQDMIEQPWPVYYNTGFALAYYLTFWTIPALVGKLFGVAAGYVCLWLYETAILFTAIGLFSYVVKAKTPGRYWLVTLVFLLFSGLNVVGAAVMQMLHLNLYPDILNHTESYLDLMYQGQSTNFYYRSNIDMIEECYNQIVIWLAIPLMLQNRKMHSFMFLGLLLAAFSPWACIGIIPFMIALAILEIKDHAKERSVALSRGKKAVPQATLLWTIKQVLSPANLIALVVIAVVFGTFFLSGAHFSGSLDESIVAVSDAIEQEGSFGILRLDLFGKRQWFGYVLFCLCEFGIFALFMAKRNKKNPLFWVTVIWLLLCPFIWVGTIWGRDFCMNASLPGLAVIMYFIMEYLNEEVAGKRLTFKNLAFICILAVAFSSPIMQLSFQANLLVDNHTWYYLTPSTNLVTFEGVSIEHVANFVSYEPDNTFFFHYLAR